jgi:outer membrane receptor for ferrienterochelin and colicin
MKSLRLLALGVSVSVLFAGPAAFCAAPGGETGSSTNASLTADQLRRFSIEDLMNVQVEDVTAASKRTEKATAAPGTVIVITAQDIRLRGYRFLHEVLRDLPGMETAPMYFSEIGTQIPIRGVVGNNKIVVLVNGMRVNPPGGENFPFRSDFSVRDAEQIEVIYGAASTLYGQDAISAVINVRTARPANGPGGAIGVAGGVNDERDAWLTFGDSAGRGGEIRLTGYLSYHASEMMDIDREYPRYWADYRAVAGDASPPGRERTADREDLGLNLFARVEWGESASLQVWHRQSERSSSEGGYGYVAAGRFVPVLHYLDEARWGDRSTVAEGRFTLPVAAGARLDSILAYNRYEIDPDSRYVWWYGSGSATNWFFDDYKYGISHAMSLEETLHWDLTPDLSLLAGISACINRSVPKSTVPGGADPHGSLIAQGGFWEYYTVRGDLSSVQRIPRVVSVRHETYAGYAELGWQAMDQLHVVAGTRVTKDTRFDEIPVTPRAAVVYDLTRELTAKYIFTRAYVAPTPYFAHATYDNGTVLAASNPDIGPEEATTHEVNLTYSRRNLMLGLSGYYGRQDDLILISDRAAPRNVVTNVWVGPGADQPRILAHSANGGSSEQTGADLYGRATFGAVSAWASYSYVDISEELDGAVTGLQGISRHNGRLGATWAITSRLFVTPSLAIRSTPVNVFAGNLAGELRSPWEVNVYVLWDACRYGELFADLRNVTNERNALGAIGGTAYPQETFSGVVGARIRY